MSLRVCRMCSTRYTEGLAHCPHCSRQDAENVFDYEVAPTEEEVVFKPPKEGPPPSGVIPMYRVSEER